MEAAKSAKRKGELQLLAACDKLGACIIQPAKRARGAQQQHSDIVKHALLAEYYPETRTLREYILSKLPATSRLRRKKILSVGRATESLLTPSTDRERTLGHLLDTTLVSFHNDSPGPNRDTRWNQWLGFSQKGDESYVTLSEDPPGAMNSQREIVEFVIWLLFSREPADRWPKHLLCDGFRKNSKLHSGRQRAGWVVPGLFSVYQNHRVEMLMQPPWPELLILLGKAGEQVMIDLLLDCAIFLAVDAGKGNLYQLSGVPISESQLLTLGSTFGPAVGPGRGQRASELSPRGITFMRSRMMYARAALNTRGSVHFGLRHIHVLNRFPINRPAPSDECAVRSSSSNNDESTIRVMMYIFPRQFGLHNVFTSVVDRRQTAQRFQDYTLREDEIGNKFAVAENGNISFKAHIPKRLRGACKNLVQKLQVLHARCSYVELLQHYCPVQEQIEVSRRHQRGAEKVLQSEQTGGRFRSRRPLLAPSTGEYASIVELATPIAKVSAFCQAVLAKVIPDEFWGSGQAMKDNKEVILKKVDHFIRLRRFETMSLHEAAQGIKFTNLEWLQPPRVNPQKCSQTDARKRIEILHEFLYYLFDSILIPLIRSNFYVTESNLHRYRLFFFRHDVWRYIAEPAITTLKGNMFEEVKMDDALRILDSRRLSFSRIRLLPKERSMRPIMNLRRRTLLRGDKKILGASINAILEPVSSVLKLEKALRPDRLGSALFSVGDIYRCLKAFKSRLGPGRLRLYFAKVDVQAAFDTIPQQAIIELMNHVPSEARYRLTKHAEVQLAESTNGNTNDNRITRRWRSLAQVVTDTTSFPEIARKELGLKKKNTVFLDSVVQKTHDAKNLIALMTSHIQQNLVKIGKKYYRQKDGIPQGSVLSSTLCNYFYADLELHHLSFLNADDSLLLRLIDDFLLITLDQDKAIKFVETMHAGFPEYGVTVNAGKSLTNFDMYIKGVRIPRLQSTAQFPYCGTVINCCTLNVSRDREKHRDPVIFNSLTVEFSRHPGQNFKRKVLNAFKIQSHLMFFDTSHNSWPTTLHNIRSAFFETATKAWAYARCLPRGAQPNDRLMIASIKELIDVSFRLFSSKSRKLRYPGYEFDVKKTQVAWLAMVAFRQLLTAKQTRYKLTLAWLDSQISWLSNQDGINAALFKLK